MAEGEGLRSFESADHIRINLGNILAVVVISTLGNSAFEWGAVLGSRSKIPLVQKISAGIDYVMHGAKGA